MLLSDCTRQPQRGFPARRWLLRLLYLAGALLALICITGLLARALVGDPPKDDIASAFSRRLGVPVSVGQARFDFVSFLLLRPTISLREVAAGNLLTAPRISARIALLPLAHRRIEIRSILIDAPHITIESDARGRTNLESLLKRLSSPPRLPNGSQPPDVPKAGLALELDDVQISGGDVLISSQPPWRIAALDLRVRNLSAGTNCSLDLSARLPGESDSAIRIEGRAGPFGPQVLPVNGKLKLTLVPRGLFGVLFRGRAGKASAVLEASIQGNLYNNVAGPARLTLAGLAIGSDATHTVPVDGEAPALFSVQRPMSAPAFHLQVLRARLKLGQGEWTGAADLQIRERTLTGASRGSLRGVDVNALLGGGRIYGILDVPAYTVRFAGTADSLDATARFSLTNGRIAALDMPASIQQAAASAQSSCAGAAGSTAFSTLTGNLSVTQARLDLSAIAFNGPALKFTGDGAIGFDHSLHFDLSASVAGRQASGDREAALPIVMAGTLDAPRICAHTGGPPTGAVP